MISAALREHRHMPHVAVSIPLPLVFQHSGRDESLQQSDELVQLTTAKTAKRTLCEQYPAAQGDGLREMKIHDTT